jgi:ribokinase
MKVLIFGSINKDYVFSVDHIVNPGETINCFDNSSYWGGKGFNQAVAVAQGGADTSFACKIHSSDELEVANLLKKYRISSGNIDVSDVPTGHAIIQIDSSGQNCIIVSPGANRTITDEFVDQTISNFSKGDVLLLQNEINKLPIIMQKAAERGMNIVFNPSPFEKQLLELPLELVDTFVLNEIECSEFTGETDYNKMQDKMMIMFPNAKLVLTLGKRGVIYRDKNVSMTHGIYDVPVVDTTAAGDTFTGYFIANFYKTFDPKESLRIASIASSIAVSRKGAIPSIPNIQEVLNSNFKEIFK